MGPGGKSSDSANDPLEEDLRLEDDWLSVEQCLACGHPKMLHRTDNGACFADPVKTNTPAESGYPEAEIEVRKTFKVECWCWAFTSDPEQASVLILKHGNHAAVRRAIEGALERGDVKNAQRLNTRLIRETSEADRDARWLDDVAQRIASLLQSRSRSPVSPLPESQQIADETMNMYPKTFSEEACAVVEAEKLRAHRDFVKQRKDAPLGGFEEVFRNYVLRVFLAFTGEACKLGHQGVFTVPQIRETATEFLRRFTIEAYYEDGFDQAGRKLGEMTSHLNGSLLRDAERKFRKSTQWQRFEDDLLAVAESQIARSGSIESCNPIARPQPPSGEINRNEASRIKGFMEQVLAVSNEKITKTNIWRVAGYKHRTEFERYQRGKGSKAAKEVFNRVLSMTPADFLKALEAKNLLL
jgi:hypothetical protein